jgi:hypothetical protein
MGGAHVLWRRLSRLCGVCLFFASFPAIMFLHWHYPVFLCHSFIALSAGREAEAPRSTGGSGGARTINVRAAPPLCLTPSRVSAPGVAVHSLIGVSMFLDRPTSSSSFILLVLRKRAKAARNDGLPPELSFDVHC